MIVNADSDVYVSQYRNAQDVDFVLFDGTTIANDMRSWPALTTDIYYNGGA
jgi:hypothetical protein